MFQTPHKGSNGCILVVFSPILVSLGVPWSSVAFRGFRYALISAIRHSNGPNSRRVTTKPPNGATGDGDPLAPEATQRGKWAYTSCAFPILAFLGVPWGSGTFASRISPYGIQMGPSPDASPLKIRQFGRNTQKYGGLLIAIRIFRVTEKR